MIAEWEQNGKSKYSRTSHAQTAIWIIAADTIIAFMGNIISGAIRRNDTLEWLETVCKS